MKYVSIEPLSGAAGDMILASLIDLGADPKKITEILKNSGLTDFSLDFQRRLCKQGILCGYLEVHTPEQGENGTPEPAIEHAPESEHSHNHHGQAHTHSHGEEHSHSHAEGHCHSHGGAEPAHSHSHSHRGLIEILGLIQQSQASPSAKQRAEKIFRRLADAEAAIHGVPPEEIHFHEVGAVDSIVDIFGTCIALDLLEIEKIFCPGHKIGYGTVRCAHGLMPVPAPATARLLEGFPVTRLPIESELTTPTGAAILTTLSSDRFYAGPCKILGTGYGHGRKEFATLPNLVRSVLFEVEDNEAGLQSEAVMILEFETDDQSPESLGYLLEKLLSAGALDVSFTAVQMKKNRPGQQVRILCRPEAQTILATLALRESSTLGIRTRQEQRLVLPRRIVEMETPWGKIPCKEVTRPGGVLEYVPEYEAARALAEAHNLPLRQVMDGVSHWKIL
ncbi:MAG: nickel pincer cofactor biosynthesis protein LarC [Lentisphaeria bacterium]